MTRLRSRIRRGANIKAKIQDKEEYQCQSQDSKQEGLSMTRLKFRIRKSANISKPRFRTEVSLMLG